MLVEVSGPSIKHVKRSSRTIFDQGNKTLRMRVMPFFSQCSRNHCGFSRAECHAIRISIEFPLAAMNLATIWGWISLTQRWTNGEVRSSGLEIPCTQIRTIIHRLQPAQKRGHGNIQVNWPFFSPSFCEGRVFELDRLLRAEASAPNRGPFLRLDS